MLLCDSVCCLRCVVGCRRCVGCCVVMTVQKTKMKSVITEKIPRNNLSQLQLYINSEILKKRIKLHHYKLKLIRKNKSAPRQIGNYFCRDGTSPRPSCSSWFLPFLISRQTNLERHASPFIFILSTHFCVRGLQPWSQLSFSSTTSTTSFGPIHVPSSHQVP